MPPITPAPVDIPEDEAGNVNSDSAATAPAHSESDSESENIDHDGYELLPQDPENCFNIGNEDDQDSSSDIEESVTAEANNINSDSLLLPAPSTPSIPSIPDISSEMITLDEERIETIKSVMKGITLPSSNLPQWASTVPEEEWKAALFSEMHSRKSEAQIHKKETPSKLSMNNNNFEAMSDVLR